MTKPLPAVLLGLCILTASACSVYDTYIVRPDEIPSLETAPICGVTTVDGRAIRFSPILMTETGSFAIIRDDSLFASVDWRIWRMSQQDIQEVWLRDRNRADSRTLSLIVGTAVTVGVILAYPLTAFGDQQPHRIRPRKQ